jgi:hypothetical protein
MQNQSQLLYTQYYIVFSISTRESSQDHHISYRLRFGLLLVGGGGVAGTIWKRLCIDIIIIYFRKNVLRGKQKIDIAKNQPLSMEVKL